MTLGGFFKNTNEIEKCTNYCKQFCIDSKLDPNECMRQNPNGTYTFGITYPLANDKNKRFLIMFSVIPSRGPNDIDSIIVWSIITPLENISVTTREEFFRHLLQINVQEIDTCTIGIDRENCIIVKVQRNIIGLDYNELKDMIGVTTIATRILHVNVCPRYNIKTSIIDPEEEAKEQSQIKKTENIEILPQIQKNIVNTIENCNIFIQQENYAQSFKIFYKTAYEILEIITKNGAKNVMLEPVKKKIENAISEVPFYNDDSKKYLLFRNIFDEILIMKNQF